MNLLKLLQPLISEFYLDAKRSAARLCYINYEIFSILSGAHGRLAFEIESGFHLSGNSNGAAKMAKYQKYHFRDLDVKFNIDIEYMIIEYFTINTENRL